jgi:sec-independent protein translocase protein TatA
MGAFSLWHWLIVLAVILLLFGGRGKIPSLMGDVAKGIRSFKTNMKDSEAAAEKPQIDAGETAAATTAAEDKAAKT